MPRKRQARETFARRPNGRIESRLRAAGYERIAGVDEVGRGCLFGPVVAAAVILDPARPVRGLNDSKALDPERRVQLAARIRERALSYAIAGVDAAWIDRVNIYQAARLAMRKAVEALSEPPDFILADAMPLDLPQPQRALIGGDARSNSIAAASIVAKVERDAWLEVWDLVYPEYGLASNRGYATPRHLEALRRLGPAPQHRRSFAPVAQYCRFPAEAAVQGAFSFLESAEAAGVPTQA